MKKILLISVLILVFLTGCSVLPGLSPSEKNIEITDSTGHIVTSGTDCHCRKSNPDGPGCDIPL